MSAPGSAVGRGLLAVVIIAVLSDGTAQAQDLDKDKSGAKLFASNCVTCHRSARGLAKNRFSWSLSSFLQQHYTSSPESAQALTAYLQSVDVPRGKPRPAAARPSVNPAAKMRGHPSRTSSPTLRPPASIPSR